MDLLALAARNGQVSTIDPTIGKLLADVRSSTSQGLVTPLFDPLVQSFIFQQKTKSNTKYPTVKFDYQVTSKHRVSFSTTRNYLMSDPDTTNSRQRLFPGFPHTGYQGSQRYTWQVSTRSVLTKNMVNEFRLGGTGGRTLFSPNTTPEMWNNDAFGDMNGYNIQWSGFKGISNAALGTGYSAREGMTKLVEDTLSWLKGRHSLTMGTSITRGDVWLRNKTNVPTIVLGRATGDPADAMFNTTNFPGTNSTDLTNGNLGTLPVLLRSSGLSAPAIPLERVYPMTPPTASSNVVTFDPNIKTPWALTGTLGLQRALTKEMAVEVRYVHSDSHGGWTLGNTSGRLNYNETMIVENGFLAEFRKAQANLAANIAAGNGSTFKHTGAPGTSPLPIFMANLLGLKGADVNDASKYTGNGWTDSTLVQSMYANAPNPQTAASNLRGNATYKENMATAGFPFNFWVVNPDVNNAQVVTNGQDTRYNGVQLMLRRRFSQGLQFEANYTYGKAYQTDFYSFRKPYKEELRKSLKIRYTTDPNNPYRTLVWHLPQDIIDNTIKAYSVNETGYTAGEPTGRYIAPANSPSCLEEVSEYGDCGLNNVLITGPPIIRVDMTFAKRIAVVGRVGLEFQIQLFNVFNRVNFNPDTSVGSTLDNYQVTGSQDSARIGQLSFRINF